MFRRASPNPTGATGVDSILTEKPVVNLPGCPPNPYNLLAVVLEYATMGKLPPPWMIKTDPGLRTTG